ncbi:MAG: DEAD/DEAH box helicase family protein [Leptospiraceae bacterium]|nr:DEAD/DEAH box helicase family protein [Leptospiraceae bacterium]
MQKFNQQNISFSNIRDNRKNGSVGEFLEKTIVEESKLSFVSAFFTIYAYYQLKDRLESISELRFLFGEPRFTKSLDPDKTDKKSFDIEDHGLSLSNRLEQSKIARDCEEWIAKKVEIKSVKKSNFLHGKLYHIHEPSGLSHAIMGSSNFTNRGIGFGSNPNIELNLIIDSKRDTLDLLSWFNELWNSEEVEDVKEEVIEYLKQLYLDYSPEFIYYKTLYHIFQKYLQDKSKLELLEEKSHFFDSLIWKSLYEFQKDGVKSAINKIEQYNGCIIADSVGLGKTFEALAIIKYYELRNDRVLVLCPKKLRDNWTVYQAANNSILNPFLEDKFGYMVLNHTDLGRDSGKQGDIDLRTLNWENFDLVVIDESHNFRNNTKGKKDEEGNVIKKSRYEKLMEDVIQKGRKTKVLLLSATPVNVHLQDLRNQIYFITAGDDSAYLFTIGIQSINQTLITSQKVFTMWADHKKNAERRTLELLEKLPSSFFKMLDQLTIARSRKHIERYYKESLEIIGKFPKRAKPISVTTRIDMNNRFVSYDKVNEEITKYKLSLFNPFAYLKEEKIQLYETKVSRMVKNFSQSQREYFLIGMMKTNFMKRIESSIFSFKITLDRTIKKIDTLEDKIREYQKFRDNKNTSYATDEIVTNEEMEDEDLKQAFEIGEKLVYKLDDLKVDEWLQDLEKDREQLVSLYNQAEAITPIRDAKLHKLKDLITEKIKNPNKNNDGKPNKKVLVFTAYADTAIYIYEQLKDHIYKELGVHTALVLGSGVNKTTLGSSRYEEILINFSPISKHREKLDKMPIEEIDVLFATDCISEGQNLQDCDYLINYDIHWNPVRIIQRFGRIDRLGSKNNSVHLVNFWPTEDLDNYIKLKHRVEARMALVDITATNEENILNVEEIENMVSDELSYRDEQLKRLQKEILDLDDLTDNVSFSEFTLDDFRVDLLNYLQSNEKMLRETPFGLYSLVPKEVEIENKQNKTVSPGVIFCLRHKVGTASSESVNPLQPFYLVYVQENGDVRYKFTHAKQILDIYRALCVGITSPIEKLCNQFNKETDNGKNMDFYNKLLVKSIEETVGVFQKKNLLALTTSRHSVLPSKKEQIKDVDDFELVTWLIIK